MYSMKQWTKSRRIRLTNMELNSHCRGRSQELKYTIGDQGFLSRILAIMIICNQPSVVLNNDQDSKLHCSNIERSVCDDNGIHGL